MSDILFSNVNILWFPECILLGISAPVARIHGALLCENPVKSDIIEKVMHILKQFGGKQLNNMKSLLSPTVPVTRPSSPHVMRSWNQNIIPFQFHNIKYRKKDFVSINCMQYVLCLTRSISLYKSFNNRSLQFSFYCFINK